MRVLTAPARSLTCRIWMAASVPWVSNIRRSCKIIYVCSCSSGFIIDYGTGFRFLESLALTSSLWTWAGLHRLRTARSCRNFRSFLASLESGSKPCINLILNTLRGYDRHRANPDWPDRNIPVGGWQLPFESFIGPDYKTQIFEGLKIVEHRYLVTEAVYRESRAALFVLANMTPPPELFFLGS